MVKDGLEVFFVALRGPCAVSVLKVSDLTGTLMTNGEMPGGDA
jgi:hypothetical protein